MVEGPVVSQVAQSTMLISTWGDYAAAKLLSEKVNDSQAERTRFILIRLSDWKIRIFPTPPCVTTGTSTVAVDSQYLYFDTEYHEIGKFQQHERLYRYRLDHFDEIGEPLE